MTSARGTVFEHRPSLTLTTLAATVLCLAIVAPFLTSLPWYLRCVLAAIAGTHGLRRLHAFRHPPVTALRLSPGGLWAVTVRSGRDVPADLIHSRLFGSAVFLHLRWRSGTGQVALLPDNTPADDLRFLRARLRTAV